LKLSRESYKVSREFVGPPLCRLWQRIEAETGSGVESDALSVSKRSETIAEAKSLFACNP
jgi:hypothetical protein